MCTKSETKVKVFLKNQLRIKTMKETQSLDKVGPRIDLRQMPKRRLEEDTLLLILTF